MGRQVMRILVAVLVLAMLKCGALWGVDTGLVAHYTFDEGKGNKLVDNSGKGNHGTIIGGAEWVKLEEGFALKFDGEDDCVNLGNDKSLNVASQCTISLWCKPLKRQGGLVTCSTGTSWPDERLVFCFSSRGQLMWSIADGKKFLSRRNIAPEIDGWQHVALTFDGFHVTLYREGLSLFGTTQRFFLPDLAGQPFFIGKSQGLGPELFNGLIDNVRIYKRALSGPELFQIFTAEAAAKGKRAPEGRKTLVVRPRNLPELGKIGFDVDVTEFRPFRKGMKLEARIERTRITTSVALDPSSWKQLLTLDARELKSGEHNVLVRVLDEGGKVIGEPWPLTVNWRMEHCLAAGRARRKRPAPKAGDLFLVRNGKPQATIVISEKPDAWTKKAAGWLAAYVQKSTGVKLPIQSDRSLSKGTVISVGRTRLRRKQRLGIRGLKWDAVRMVVRGNTLFLFGKDQLNLDSRGAKGTCKAVVQFLEDYVGVRWFLPTPKGELVPRNRDIAAPSDLDRTVTPAFAYISGRRPYGDGTPAAIANNFRTAINIRSYGGHSYYSWLPAETYFKDHPEYFALIDGKRTGHGNHLCSTNPEVKKILLKGIQAEFDKGYDWVQLGQEDGFRKCECAQCEALDEYTNHYEFRSGYSDWYKQLRDYPCERLLLLHKWIVDECRKSHPNKTVHLLVYGPTAWPSKKFDKWGDNVVAEMCVQRPNFVAAWKGKVRGMTGYVYWFDISLSRGLGIHATQREVAHTMRYLHEQGFVGLYTFPQANWGLSGPSFYILGKLAGDPFLDYTALREEYCLGIYGPMVGKTMNQFFTALDDVPEVCTHIWLPEHVAKLEVLLRRAESQATAEREKEWLQLTRDHFEYSKLLSRMLLAYRNYKEDPDDAKWAQVKKAVGDFEDFRHKILHYPDKHIRAWFPGHDRFCNFLTAPHLGRRGYYANWLSRRKEILAKKIRGTGFGWGSGGVDYPVGLDFKNPPHRRPQRK